MPAWRMPEKDWEKAAGGLVAFPLRYEGPDAYAKALDGTGYGLVLDDDGETGYLYVTSEDFSEVHDALHVYNIGEEGAPAPGDSLYIVYSERLAKAGLYFRDGYRAIVDFRNAAACCRSGQPAPNPSGWCRSAHDWDHAMETGLSFYKIEGEGGQGPPPP